MIGKYLVSADDEVTGAANTTIDHNLSLTFMSEGKAAYKLNLVKIKSIFLIQIH